MLQIEHKLLRIPADGKPTSWLFTQRGGEVEIGNIGTNPNIGRVEDLNQGRPSDLNHLTTAPSFIQYFNAWRSRSLNVTWLAVLLVSFVHFYGMELAISWNVPGVFH